MFAFQCNPIAFAWDKTIPNGKCIDFNMMCLTTSILGVVTDFATLLLPLPILWKLQMHKKRKWGLTGVFLLGGLSVLQRLPNTLESLLTSW